MNQPWLREEWYSSPLTFASEVQSQLHFPEKVEILDLTLDENGEGMAGARMTEEQKLVVARQLDEMGVHRIGVLGYPARVTPQEIEQMKENVAAAAAICRTLKKARPTALASTLEDIDRAASIGVQEVVLRQYVTHVQDIEPQSNESKAAAFIELGEHARKKGLRVSMLAQGITRSKVEDIREILTTIHSTVGLDEICLTDTHGVGTPHGFAHLVKLVKSWVPVPLQVHCHDHLGLGVANACFAVSAGASVIHTTVHGMGHLAGLAALEEVAVALTVGYGIDLNINYEGIFELSQTVERFTGIQMPPHKPVVGMRAFVNANDAIYNQMNLERRRAGIPRINILPYVPEWVGNRERVFLGDGLTEEAIRWNLELLGMPANDDQVKEIYARSKAFYQKMDRPASDDEFMEIALKIVSPASNSNLQASA